MDEPHSRPSIGGGLGEHQRRAPPARSFPLPSSPRGNRSGRRKAITDPVPLVIFLRHCGRRDRGGASGAPDCGCPRQARFPSRRVAGMRCCVARLAGRGALRASDSNRTAPLRLSARVDWTLIRYRGCGFASVRGCWASGATDVMDVGRSMTSGFGWPARLALPKEFAGSRRSLRRTAALWYRGG